MSRVLLVEDERDIRVLTRLILETSGHEVVESPDGETAIGFIERRESFDVVLLDLRLPGKSGWDVMATINASAAVAVPVIVFSAQIGPAEQERAQSMGAVGYITKPFSDSELLTAIEAATR